MHSPSSLRPLATHLADLLCAPDGAETARLLRLFGLLGDYGSNVAPAPQVDYSNRTAISRVGIWQRKPLVGKEAFVRDVSASHEWQDWANVGRIDPKRTRWRVVLVGESVARGYFYDPEYTPALVLQQLLGQCLGEGMVEVIDLARTGLAFEMAELALSATALEPDAIVIFGGNNLRSAAPRTDLELEEAYSVLRERGIAGWREVSESKLRSAVTSVAERIEQHYSRLRVPVVWVVPEFNLADWHDWLEDAPPLADGPPANEEWVSYASRVERLLADGSLAEAARLAQRMAELDGGTCSLGASVLGQVCSRQGKLEEARKLLQAARDARSWDWSHTASPRTHEITAAAWRSVAAGREHALVDLPRLFEQRDPGRLPDRRLFLDYCHLNVNGLRIAIAGVAMNVAAALSARKPPLETLIAKAAAPTAPVRAEASFLAAIHNAHWWQHEEIVRHHCDEALQASMHVADVMNSFLDMQTGLTPMLMSRSAEQLMTVGGASVQRYILRSNVAQLDPVLLRSIVDSLAAIGIARRDHLIDSWVRNHSVTHGACDLLRFYNLAGARQPRELLWTFALPGAGGSVPADYYRAYWIESRFTFIAEKGVAVVIALTCRLPVAAASQPVAMLMNGVPIATPSVGKRWTSVSLQVPGELIERGINQLTVRWPLRAPAASWGLATGRLSESPAPFSTVYGEIHALSARSDDSTIRLR